MSAGLVVSIAGLAGVPAGALASSNCPAPAVVKRGTSLTPVTKANYAVAETEVILGDYVRKIAKGTCGTGVGEFLHQKGAMDPKERTLSLIHI